MDGGERPGDTSSFFLRLLLAGGERCKGHLGDRGVAQTLVQGTFRGMLGLQERRHPTLQQIVSERCRHRSRDPAPPKPCQHPNCSDLAPSLRWSGAQPCPHRQTVQVGGGDSPVGLDEATQPVHVRSGRFGYLVGGVLYLCRREQAWFISHHADVDIGQPDGGPEGLGRHCQDR